MLFVIFDKANDTYYTESYRKKLLLHCVIYFVVKQRFDSQLVRIRNFSVVYSRRVSELMRITFRKLIGPLSTHYWSAAFDNSALLGDCSGDHVSVAMGTGMGGLTRETGGISGRGDDDRPLTV